MADRRDKAAEYRRQAERCLEVSREMSLQEDREKLTVMAEHWISLAEQMEAEKE